MMSASVVVLANTSVRIVATTIATTVTQWSPALIQIRAVQQIARIATK